MSNDNIKSDSGTSSALEKQFQELGRLLYNIKNDFDEYSAHFSLSNNSDVLERFVCMEKDVENLFDKFDELKEFVKTYKDTSEKLDIEYQSLAGSVNQLKLNINEINKRYDNEREQKTNIFWQLFVPILLSIIFFVFGVIFRSCSSIHNNNLNIKGEQSEYITFEYPGRNINK